MEIRVLHIDDCPNWEVTGSRVRRALESVGLRDVPVEVLLIRTADDAVRLGFAGSPTILVDGHDLFPSEGRTADLACRVYLTDAGFAGAPTVAQLEQALKERAALS